MWILAGVVGLLGAILCVTVILLPLGIPLLMLARRLGSTAFAMVMPRAVRHPVSEVGRKNSKLAKKARKSADKGRSAVSDAKPGKKARKVGRKIEKKTGRRNRLGMKKR